MTHGVDIVVLSCPSCETPLVFYHGQTFAIDAAELKYLKSQGHVREAQGWIRTSGPKPLPSEANPGSDSPATSEHQQPSRPGVLPVRERAEAIGDDDILNLRIDLQRCDSVDDFLKLLG